MSPRTKRPDGTGCGLCSGDPVTTISGVRLCQPHLDRVQEIAADAGIDATAEVSRAPTAEEVRAMGDAISGREKIPQGTPVNCTVCGKETRGGTGLAVHMRSHAPNAPVRAATAIAAPRREKAPPIVPTKPDDDESVSGKQYPITLANIRTCALHVGIAEEQADRLLDLLRFLRKLNQAAA